MIPVMFESFRMTIEGTIMESISWPRFGCMVKESMMDLAMLWPLLAGAPLYDGNDLDSGHAVRVFEAGTGSTGSSSRNCNSFHRLLRIAKF